MNSKINNFPRKKKIKENQPIYFIFRFRNNWMLLPKDNPMKFQINNLRNWGNLLKIKESLMIKIVAKWNKMKKILVLILKQRIVLSALEFLKIMFLEKLHVLTNSV